MAAVLNFVPYVGSATTLLILSVVALVTFDGVGRIAAVMASYLALATIADLAQVDQSADRILRCRQRLGRHARQVEEAAEWKERPDIGFARRLPPAPTRQPRAQGLRSARQPSSR